MSRIKNNVTGRFHLWLLILAAVMVGGVLAGTNAFTVDESSAATNGAYIGVDKAKQICLDNAGAKASEVTFIKARFDFDDGIANYDIEFIKGGKEYEYEVNALKGNVMEKSIEPIKRVLPSIPANITEQTQPQPTQPAQPQDGQTDQTQNSAPAQSQNTVYYDDDYYDYDDRYDDWDDRYDDDRYDDRYDDDRYDDDGDDDYDGDDD